LEITNTPKPAQQNNTLSESIFSCLLYHFIRVWTFIIFMIFQLITTNARAGIRHGEHRDLSYFDSCVNSNNWETGPSGITCDIQFSIRLNFRIFIPKVGYPGPDFLKYTGIIHNLIFAIQRVTIMQELLKISSRGKR
jgi:hypothetical protein